MTTPPEERYIVVYPENIRVLVKGDDEYLIPENLDLHDENNEPLILSEYDAYKIGKLQVTEQKIEFFVRKTKIGFHLTLYNQLKIYIDDKPKCNAGYRILYFSKQRKLWIDKHCIQLPAYLASFLQKQLRTMAKNAKVVWTENRIEFMDDKKNFIQLSVANHNNISLVVNGKQHSSLVRLDYYPQKNALWTGKMWLDVAKYFDDSTDVQTKRKLIKLQQLDALFAMDGVTFGVKKLCGYPHCPGFSAKIPMTCQCINDECQLNFHNDCVIQINREFKDFKEINCPLHYEQIVPTLEIPTFASHLKKYDELVRDFPARPKRNMEKKFRALKLTKTRIKELQLARKKTRLVTAASATKM